MKFTNLSPFEIVFTLNIFKEKKLSPEEKILNRGILYLNYSPNWTNQKNSKKQIKMVSIDEKLPGTSIDHMDFLDVKHEAELGTIEDLQIDRPECQFRVIAINKSEAIKFCVIRNRRIVFFRRRKKHAYVICLKTFYDEKSSTRNFLEHLWINLKEIKKELLNEKELKESKFSNKEFGELYTANVHDLHTTADHSTNYFFMVERDPEPGITVCNAMSRDICKYIPYFQFQIKGSLIKNFQVYLVMEKEEMVKDGLQLKRRKIQHFRIGFGLPVDRSINVFNLSITNNDFSRVVDGNEAEFDFEYRQRGHVSFRKHNLERNEDYEREFEHYSMMTRESQNRKKKKRSKRRDKKKSMSKRNDFYFETEQRLQNKQNFSISHRKELSITSSSMSHQQSSKFENRLITERDLETVKSTQTDGHEEASEEGSSQAGGEEQKTQGAQASFKKPEEKEADSMEIYFGEDISEIGSQISFENDLNADFDSEFQLNKSPIPKSFKPKRQSKYYIFNENKREEPIEHPENIFNILSCRYFKVKCGFAKLSSKTSS